ncbi:MAG: glycogen synthase GlgA [bacterium]
MRILIVSSEVAPLAKTGGLADVAGSLPPALKDLGHDVAVCLPKYRVIEKSGIQTEVVQPLAILIGSEAVEGQVEKATLPGADVPVYLIQQDAYFNRAGLYDIEGRGYPDNLARFSFFCRGVLNWLERSDWIPDIIHCSDWQTALIPLFLKTEFSQGSKLEKLKTLFTIHNLAFQGLFPAEQISVAGIGWEHFHIDGIEFWGQISLMKGALIFSDHLSTVSRRYSEEIQTEEFGCGLDGVLRKRAKRLHGILNGVDYSAWDPRSDSLIERTYGPETVGQGKVANKKALINLFGLSTETLSKPLIGIVTRLAYQKGIDLLVEVLPDIIADDTGIVILGTGELNLEEALTRLAKEFPESFGVKVAYNDSIAHLIEAGADMFLMPSRYEPCGLNQLYSLKYGTIPIVRRTGGLADTIIDVDENPEGNGFVFRESASAALLDAVKRATTAFRQPQRWNEIVQRAMAQEFSWSTSAKTYEDLYSSILREG